ncbi:MAG: hypothetical protein FWG12_04900 [Holophagaceae bacterium]|nr:hypothetical protein [Holophagaceae bacterium]
METPKEVRSLIDQLGQAMVQAVMADKEGQRIIMQIQETGFDVGVMLEATVALHPKQSDGEDESSEIGAIDEGILSNLLPDSPEIDKFEWSEEDRALMCNFRISLD